MRARLWLLLLLFVPPVPAQVDESSPRVTEVVADPYSDWDGDGRVTSSDEFVELKGGPQEVDLTGWSLWLNDSTPVRWALEGVLPAHGWRAFVNPSGEINNNGHVALLDPSGRVVDEVRFGTWPGASGVPDANAGSAADEALRRSASGWDRGHATPGGPPDRPFVRAAWPFVARDGQAWAAPRSNSSLAITWTDSDRSYVGAWLALNGNRSAAIMREAGTTVWVAEANVTLGEADAHLMWELNGAAGENFSAASQTVRLDVFPPAVPSIDAPAWSNGTTFEWRTAAASDVGVGGVEYLLETRGEGQAWSTVREWNASLPRSTGAAPVWLRVSVRDAFGNTAVGDPHRVGLDTEPPSRPTVRVGGYERVELHWDPVADNGSGLERLRLDRVGDGLNRTWWLPANETRFEDRTIRLGSYPSYELRGYDRAGNEGPAARVGQEWEGARPHARVRLGHEAWGAGDLRLWVDFDRKMDVARDPHVVVLGGRVDGRWLSNGTTWSAVVEPDPTRPEGRGTVALLDAWDRAGRTLWRPVEASVLVDTSPPRIVATTADAWVNASGLRLMAEDSLDPRPVLRYRVGNDTTWSTQVGEVVLEVPRTLRVEAVAIDASGRRSAEWRRTVRVDGEAPWVRVVGMERGRWGAQVGDNASGVAHVTVFRAGNATPTVKEGDLHWLTEPGPFVLRAMDRVGNAREVHGVVEVLPTRLEAPSFLESRADREEPTDALPQTARTAPAPPGGLVALLAAGSALIRRRTPPPDAS